MYSLLSRQFVLLTMSYLLAKVMSSSVADVLFQCSPILSPVFNECRKSDQCFICYVVTHTDDPQQFRLNVDLTMRERF
jgi:hypothetical protein